MRRSSLLSVALVVVGSWRLWIPSLAWCLAGRGGPATSRSRVSGSSARRAGVTFEDPYSVLGLPPGTRDENEVRSAARRLIKLYHPDVPGTGDVDKFQAVQEAAHLLLEAGPGGTLQSSLERVYQWSSTPSHTHASRSARPASSAEQTLQQADFAGSRGSRVDIAACKARRRPDLRKTPKLKALTHQARPETLAVVQAVLARQLGVPEEAVVPAMPLEQLGFYLEGQGSVGMQYVADTIMALEEEFGVELLTILVGTWVRFTAPESVCTVQGMADFVESKVQQ